MVNATITRIAVLVAWSAIAAQAGVIIQDDFFGMGDGVNVSNSVLEVGSGAWSGSLVSSNGTVVVASSADLINEGASIPLPVFDAGDVITIKATLGSGAVSWWGLGFANTDAADLSGNTPWATYYPDGQVVLFGGTSVANNMGSGSRASGAITSEVFEVEFIYDTGAGTVTIIADGETTHQNVAIATSGIPTLNHAFLIFRRPATLGANRGYLDRFQVEKTSPDLYTGKTIKVGEAELIYAQAEIPIRYDGTISTLRKYGNDDMYFFSSFGCRIEPGGTRPSRHAWFSGPPEDPLRILDTEKTEEDLWNYNGYYQDTDQEGIWILAMHELDNGDLLAITHAELNYPGDATLRFALGLGYSTDRGEHWTYCGEIARASTNTMNVGGGAYILRGDYIYAYYNDKDLAVSNLRIACVARANLDEVAAAAAEHRVTVWNTYRAGQWDIPALSSTPGSDVLRRVYGNEDMHADAAYCTELGRYLMTSHDTPNHKLLLFSSEDGVDWTLETIVDETDEYVLHPYAAFVDYNSPTDDGRVVDGSFYIYYPRMMIDNQNNSTMYRRFITVAKVGVLFSQDFSSSTNAGDYVDATTPTANQFTVINGGITSIDAERLKIINAAGAGGNVQRWIDMAGTPVGAMSFSYEMDLTFSESNNVRLFTGTIGQPNAGNHWMAWGVDATGTDNEWRVTGSTATFTGAQTMTILMNDSESAINYTDPATGTQLLSTNSYDVWVGTTQVADGKTDAFVHPEKDLTAFSLGLAVAPAGTYYFDNFEVADLPAPIAIVYQDDFSGAATNNATATVPEVKLPGFSHLSYFTGLDGSGRLESTSSFEAAANYRFQIDTNPLTDDASITEIKYTAVLRAPTNDWVMIGFHETSANGLLTTTANVGPMVQFNPTSVILRGGTYSGTTNGNISLTFNSAYPLSSVITAEMTYHVDAGTMDLVINGSTVTTGFALEHEFPVGTLSDPIVWWAQLQLRNQPSAADGGAYIDSFQIQTTVPLFVPVLGYAGWAAGWGVDIGAETTDYDGDGLSNIYEYGLGGDPTNALDQGTASLFGAEKVGGTNYFDYVHPQLADPDSGLSYSLALNTNLVVGNWVTNSGYVILGTNVTGGSLDYVTNVTDTVDAKKYIRLIIE